MELHNAVSFFCVDIYIAVPDDEICLFLLGIRYI
jgi:hypothetical protein